MSAVEQLLKDPWIRPPAAAHLDVVVMHAAPVVAAGLVACLARYPGLSPRTGDRRTLLVERQRWGVPAPGAATGATRQVVILDYESGLDFLALLRGPGAAADMRTAIDARVLIFSEAVREQPLRTALSRGADGFLAQSSSEAELVAAVLALGAGGRFVAAEAAGLLADGYAREALTGRQVDVLRLLSEGRTNKAIAHELGISYCTVKSHVQAILSKLDVVTRTEAARVAQSSGYVESTAMGDRPSRSGTPQFKSAGRALVA